MKNLKLQIFLCLIVFAVILVFVITYINRQVLMNDIHTREVKNLELIEDHILKDMQTVDTAHYYLDTEISNEMEDFLRGMIRKYEEDPDVLNWDLYEMKGSKNFDIYILDQTNTVIKTTFEKDVGLSFSECCKKFSLLLDHRRASGLYYSDGIDISSTTGEISKYSYLGTPDNQYLFELGISVRKLPVYRQFNFVSTANYLVEMYDELLEVRILNDGGFFLNDSISRNKELSVKEMPSEFQEAFMTAKQTMKPVEYHKEHENGLIDTYRFIPYKALLQRGDSTNRVIYFKYNNNNELVLLKQNIDQFWKVLAFSFLITIFILILIFKILSKTFNLAKYDPLTGVNNRATYISYLDKLTSKNNNLFGLLLVDLDNFKQVNDQFGHAKGDEVLIETAKILQSVSKKQGLVARIGGDEFAIVVPNATIEKLDSLANCVITKYRDNRSSFLDDEINKTLSLSIGGALSMERENELNLYVRADEALYKAKKAGKDQYVID